MIIAEPVGSCADLSATILQPLKQYWDRELRISPLTVLADPLRLTSILREEHGGLHPDAVYIYRKQLEESDIILISKTDLLSEGELEELRERTAEKFPSATLCTISVARGTGVDEWLEEVSTRTDAGKRLIDMDYDIYANGEAVLGWLNGTIHLKGEKTDWDLFARELVTALSRQFDTGGYAVGHVKIIAENGKDYIAGNITGSRETLSLRGSAGESREIRLIINARVETTPEELDKIVRETIDNQVGTNYTTKILAWRYLQPGRPQPTHRFTEVV